MSCREKTPDPFVSYSTPLFHILTEDLAGYAHGWRADADDLRIDKVEAPAWDDGESQWFRPGSHRYPDWDESAG